MCQSLTYTEWPLVHHAATSVIVRSADFDDRLAVRAERRQPVRAGPAGWADGALGGNVDAEVVDCKALSPLGLPQVVVALLAAW